ncbi:MAG: 2-oxoacid:ferredoxin oxidoreductase subunit beta [Candidatus Aminicenantes bacterium]|nr:2-oxoacid:ferredoxin oxidoreductase subunit beta [Candidatus Aminicenantes bacterium]
MKKDIYHLADPTWCRGCGIFGLFAALKMASSSLRLLPEATVVVTGIGCHGRLNNYFNSYGFHGLHGRALPIATGVKLSNKDLTVLAVSGDGDAYSIGLSHFIHTARRNVNLTLIVVNNSVFGLTQGQTSPTSLQGYVSVSTPYGSKEIPLDGPLLALVSGGTYIARGFSGNPKQLAALLKAAIRHNGFSLLEVLSPCVTHNKINTKKWFQDHIYDADTDPGYDPKNKIHAITMMQNSDRLPVGTIYKEKRPSFDDLSLPGATPIVATNLKVEAKRLYKLLEKFE